MNKTEKYIYDNFLTDINTLGYDIADIQYVKEAGEYYLRIFIDYIDKKDLIGINDCEVVNRRLSDLIDEDIDAPATLLNQPYRLEVSSPGIERPLKKVSDYTKYINEKVAIYLFSPVNQSKIHIGVIVGVDENKVVINSDNEVILEFSYKDIAKAHLYFDF